MPAKAATFRSSNSRFAISGPYVTKRNCRVDIIYRPTASAKIVFDYEIRAVDDETLLATGHSVQAFMDRDYNLLWYKPEFFVRWEERWGIFTDRLPL